MLYPLTFIPEFKERIWGGRALEKLFNKPLPPDLNIGESWEIADRPETSNIIANGQFKGKSLQWLMQNYKQYLLGDASSRYDKFPLLVKILDVQDRVSLQVHPDKATATRLGAEPKTEIWYIVDAGADAEILVGLKKGITKEAFLKAIENGSVEDCFHRFNIKTGDAIFLPAGRIHGVKGPCVIFEIQENSDSTFRIYDWNRLDANGRPRKIHVSEALQCINFTDFEPGPINSKYSQNKTLKIRFLAQCPEFTVDAIKIKRKNHFYVTSNLPIVYGIVSGELNVVWQSHELQLRSGDFLLVPPGLEKVKLYAISNVETIQASL